MLLLKWEKAMRMEKKLAEAKQNATVIHFVISNVLALSRIIISTKNYTILTTLTTLNYNNSMFLKKKNHMAHTCWAAQLFGSAIETFNDFTQSKIRQCFNAHRFDVQTNLTK